MESLNALTAPLKNYALVTVIALGAIVTLPLFLKGWLSSIVRTMLIVGLGGYVYSAYTITSRKLEKEIERVDPT
jgi:type III secretory pathway component EscT